MIGAVVDGVWRKEWERSQRKWEGAVTERELGVLKKRWQDWVVSPVDKYATDGILLCPLQYILAVERLATSGEKLKKLGMLQLEEKLEAV